MGQEDLNQYIDLKLFGVDDHLHVINEEIELFLSFNKVKGSIMGTGHFYICVK